MSLEEEMR